MRSPGAATGNKSVQFFEHGVGNTVGGGAVAQKNLNTMLDETSRRLTSLADELSPTRTAFDAGAQLKRGGREFIDGFRKQAASLEDDFARLVRPGSPVEMGNTLQALRGESGKFPSSQQLGELLSDAQLGKFAAAIDEAGGKLSFAEARRLRSAIGRRLSKPVIMEDIPRAELERTYAALTNDMRASIQHRPDVLKAFDKAVRYERQGFKRISDSLSEIASPDSAVNPERVFSMVQNIAQQQGRGTDLRKLAQIRRSVKPEQWRATASAVLRRMGQARPGQQGAADVGQSGGEFSVNTFLTEWNKISPEARNLLFKGVVDDGFVASLNGLVKVAGALKDLERSGNFSGTARVLQAMGITSGLGAAAGLALGGDIESAGAGAVAGIAGRVVAPNIAARLIGNPKFVRWLARAGTATARNPNSLPKHLARLVLVSKASPDIRDEIAQYADALRSLPAPDEGQGAPRTTP